MAKARMGVLLLALPLAFCPACGRGAGPEKPPRKVKVFVSIPPQAYFVQRVGGSRVEVGVLAQAGRDPHNFDPTPKQIAQLSQARLYFRVGLPFEDQLVTKIRAGVIDTRKGIALREMTADEMEGEHGVAAATRREHGRQEHPGQAAKDPHIWLDPKLVKVQAQTICDALGEVDPGHSDEYAENLKAFQADLDKLDKKIARSLGPLRGKEFFVFHPAFGYFAASYGLRQRAVEIAGKEAGPRQVAEVIARAKKAGARVIFVEPQFSDKAARTIAREIGGAVVRIDPLSGDYVGNLENVAAEIEKALGKDTGQLKVP